MLLLPVGDRLRHVRGVAARVMEMGASDLVVAAAWLHDIGYAAELVRSGMHAVDGADYLARLGAPQVLTSLVAYHTGAVCEAQELGLESRLNAYAQPDQGDLDLLTYADLTTSSTGERVTYSERVAEIFRRYPVGHPVHRAVTRSQDSLAASCRRAAVLNGYPM